MIPEGQGSIHRAETGNGIGIGSGATEAEAELAQALDAYLSAVEAGQPVDPEDWIAQHPAIADRLRACLKGLHLVEAAAEAFATAEEAATTTPKVLADDGSGFGSGADSPGKEGLRLGDFQIVRELGRGGMGVVYEAEQRSLGRRVALKVLPFAAAIDPRQIARFRVEAQAASHLRHPHIVPVHSVGCERGVHYYAMQLVDGSTLAELIAALRCDRDHDGDDDRDRDRAGARPDAAPTESLGSTPVPGVALPAAALVPPPELAGWTRWKGTFGSGSTRFRSFCCEVARLGLQAALALDHAHQQGVLHRDIKPSNLIVDARGHLWVTDFGLARFQGEGSLTATGDLLGTLRYMSPEQALANRAVVDQRTDVYSLGATLYELLTLQPVFEGTDRQELLRRIAQEEPRRPRALNPAIPADLETIVLKALAKEPQSRYATAGELADDLGRYHEDRPILARRPGPLERSARWARRHVAIVLTALPLLALLVLGLTAGIVLVLAKQAEIRRQQDEVERSRAATRRQRDEARRAVNDMYTQVAEEWLDRQPSLQPLQRDFLKKALAYYQAFALESDPDPAVRAEAGAAALHVGEIQRKLGRHAESERAYHQAITVLETIMEKGSGTFLAEAGPARAPTSSRIKTAPAPFFTAHSAQILDSLSRSYGGLGELLLETGRSAEAQAALGRAVALTQALVEATPSSAAGRPALAAAFSRLGTLLQLAGRFSEAEHAYRKALELDKAIGEARRLSQAGTLANLAFVLDQTGRPGEAQQSYRRAAALYEPLVAGEPGVPLYRRELAGTLLNLGVLLFRQADPGRPDLAEAERSFRRALALYERLSADAPAVPQFRQELTLALMSLGNLLASTGRSDEAESLLRRAVANHQALAAELPDRPGDRGELALARFHLALLLAARGTCSEARRLLEQAIADQQEALRSFSSTSSSSSSSSTTNLGSRSNSGEAIGRQRLRRQREALAGVLVRCGAHAAAAGVVEDLIRDAQGDRQTASRAATYLTSCAALAGRDQSLAADRREAVARSYALRACDLLRQAAQPAPAGDRGDPAAPYHLAWFLTNCPVAELRDPAEALGISQAEIERTPRSWIAWATLGAAQYRANDWHEALASLERAASLNQGQLAFFDFFLAMTHHQLDHPDQALRCFDQADRWLQAMPWDESAHRLRTEAGELIRPPRAGRAAVPQESPEEAARPD
jgi:tetratricopeptide (TPR) repeat protein